MCYRQMQVMNSLNVFVKSTEADLEAKTRSVIVVGQKDLCRGLFRGRGASLLIHR
jgi:hypothetical protein